MTARRALVTGAATRVGRSIALHLASAGWDVAVHCHESRQPADEVASQIRALGRQCRVFAADLSQDDAAAELVDATLDAFGGLELLVASAANFERVELDAVDAGHFQRALALNLVAPFFLVQRARAALARARGSVVLVTCSSATTPFRNHLPYVVSKGALSHLTRVLALELAPDVRVNSVAPGTVLPPLDMSQSAVARLAASVPLARAGTADDVAAAVLYLATAQYITGEELRVDGGRTVARVERFD